MESMTVIDQRKKVHPHKFLLWMAIGSIAMMFAGLTSGYVVKEAAGNWRNFHLPIIFWVSTAVILLSSVTIALGLKAFRRREMPKYKQFISLTLFLGLAFGALQFLGFYELYSQPQQVIISGEVINRMLPVTLSGNPSESFLFIIFGIHLLHILGGIIALAIVFFRAFRKRIKVYNATGLEIVATYWHFVDILWVYLFIFFLANQ
ncbi:MAG: cytochrome c oxidase subunit 3 [Bacteroidetes bacterium]|nr:cytochrome c oxidase subunit 3 [Bacteroidota bacterium]